MTEKSPEMIPEMIPARLGACEILRESPDVDVWIADFSGEFKWNVSLRNTDSSRLSAVREAAEADFNLSLDPSRRVLCRISDIHRAG